VKEGVYQFLYKSRIGGALIALLVFASLTLFTLETEFQDLEWLKQASYAIACIFALEYFLRIKRALNECKSELGVSVLISISLIFIGAVLIYFAESRVQPEAFGSIPRALWWSMATLTTVGYGDTYPITLFGKVIASAMAMVGIGAVALPAGVTSLT